MLSFACIFQLPVCVCVFVCVNIFVPDSCLYQRQQCFHVRSGLVTEYLLAQQMHSVKTDRVKAQWVPFNNTEISYHGV